MAFVTVWQMPKKKLILCHVTLNLPVTLVTQKILNITLRNVPMFVPMLMLVSVRGLSHSGDSLPHCPVHETETC